MDHMQPVKTSISYAQRTGRRHLQEGAPCEDVIHVQETQSCRFYGVADGQSGKSHCIEGGQRYLRYLAGYMKKRGIASLAAYSYMDELQYELMRGLRRCIRSLSTKYGAPREEFSSTVVAIAFDPITGDYIIVHLGDGRVVAMPHGGQIVELSKPDNGLTSKHTWFVTSDNALSHLRLAFGNVRRYSRLAVMTDGADACCWGYGLRHEAKIRLARADRQEIVSRLEASEPRDDASCIVIDIHAGPPS